MKRPGAWPVSFPIVIGPIAIGLILMGAMLVVSCAKPYHEENERYVFVATNINLPYWQEAQAGFMDAAKSLGVRAELVGPTGYAPNAELLQFRGVAGKHPAGLCSSAGGAGVF